VVLVLTFFLHDWLANFISWLRNQIVLSTKSLLCTGQQNTQHSVIVQFKVVVKQIIDY